MLSMSFLGVRGLPRPPPGSSLSMAVQHGAQRQWTRSIGMDKSMEATETDDERDKALWDDEVEIYDKEGQETVEISLVYEFYDKEGQEKEAGVERFGWGRSKKRSKFRQSIATVEMRTFRAEPEQSVTLWLSLRPVASSNIDEDAGAVRVKCTYWDDCVAQGYLFALFCGLVPLSLPGLWVDDAHVERKKLGAGYPRTVTAPPSPAPRALLAELVENEQGQGSERTSSSPAAAHQLKLVSQTAAPAPVSPTGIQRKVHFAPFSGPALG